MSHIISIGVAGLPESGKTTFINTISEQDIQNIGHLLIESGEIQVDFDEICLQENPPQHWEVIFEAKTGVVLLVDSTQAHTFDLIRNILPLPVPYVIAANKQNLPGAYPVSDIDQRLQTAVVGCTATDETSVKACLTTLANIILEQT